MMKKLLKRSLILGLTLFAFTLSAQTVTFSSGLEGWAKSFGDNGDVTHAPTEGVSGDGALKIVRKTDNANFGIKPNTGINATTKKYIRIRYKNETKGTTIRIGGKNDDGVALKTNGGGNIEIGISPDSDEYTTTYIDLSSHTLWKGELTDFIMYVRKNAANDVSGSAFYLDEIEFLDNAPANTYSEFIQNPSFDGPSGVSHLTGNVSFGSRAITSKEFHDGTQSLKKTFTANPDKPYWTFTTFEKKYTSKFPVNSDIQIKMWVKSNRTTPYKVSARVKTTDGGADTSTKPITTVTTTNTTGGWEELTFDLKNAEEFDGILFWFALDYTDGEATNLASGDIVYFDQMTASITAATASLEKNTLQGVSVYPNPVRDILHIKAPTASKIQLFNILGASVKSTINTTDEFEMSVSDLPRGVYMLKISSENKTKTTKVVIK